MAEVKSIDKRWYKITLEVLKVIPMLIAFCDLLHTIFSLMGYEVPLLSIIGGVSFLTLAFLYLVSYVFRYCVYHRMFLHYVLVNNIFSTIEFSIGIPVSYLGLCCMYFGIAGIFLFLILFYYRREKCCKLSKDCCSK